MRQRLTGALLMAAAVGALLAVQFVRGSWPFTADHPPGASAATTGQAGTVSPQARAALDATDPTFTQLGVQVEPVLRESLSRTVRVIATVAPDETRISHVHTRVAGWLEQHPAVEKVYYPGLATHPYYEVARSQMRGFGGLITFAVRGADWQATARVVDAVKLPRIGPSLGGVESLIEQPLVMSYYECTPEDRRRYGIADNMIRLSCGVEDTEDLIADLSQALALHKAKLTRASSRARALSRPAHP